MPRPERRLVTPAMDARPTIDTTGVARDEKA